jgi:glutathione S-transferase
MKLYDFKPAPNPRRVRMFLAEKGVSIPSVQVVLMKGEQKLPDFVAKNPFARVPVLELDDGKYLSESAAICRYIEELHPTPSLLGGNSEQRAFIDMWQRSAEFELMFPVTHAFRHGTEIGKGLEPNQNAAWAATSRARALNGMRIFNDVLSDRPFIAGPDFSIADITLICSIDFGANTSAVTMPEGLKHLKRWHEEVSARPSAKA